MYNRLVLPLNIEPLLNELTWSKNVLKTRLVVLKYGLWTCVRTRVQFGGLGLGRQGLGLERLKNQVLYQVHTQTDDGNGLFSKWRSHFPSYWISLAKNIDRCNRKWLTETDGYLCCLVPTKAQIPPGSSRHICLRPAATGLFLFNRIFVEPTCVQ